MACVVVMAVRQHIAENREQRVGSREQVAESKQQASESRQQLTCLVVAEWSACVASSSPRALHSAE
jgi:hypothetical protein